MTKAIWNDTVIAESDETVIVEGNHYFPPQSVKQEFLQDSDRKSICPWKGIARYYDIVVNGEKNAAAAWYYSSPKPEASQIKDHVAFWGGVNIVND